MQSIVVVIPYFGMLPVQYAAWRASALENPSVDFMFFTDADVEPAANIVVHRMTFGAFRQLVQAAFDFPVVLDRPYKLCEYKQAYGYILQQYIKTYDFWGFGDLDLVYGDIRAFITEEVLTHKFILGWGHLTLLHNDAQTNTYFMVQVPGYQNYRDAFSTAEITFFDEFNHKGCSDKWRDCRPDDCWLETPFDNAPTPKYAFHLCSWTRHWQQVVFEHIGGKLYIVKFEHGKVVKSESLYAHFQHRNFMRDKVNDYGHFLVTPASIIDFPLHFVRWRLRWYCRRRPLMTKLYMWHDILVWRLGREKWR